MAGTTLEMEGGGSAERQSAKGGCDFTFRPQVSFNVADTLGGGGGRTLGRWTKRGMGPQWRYAVLTLALTNPGPQAAPGDVTSFNPPEKTPKGTLTWRLHGH